MKFKLFLLLSVSALISCATVNQTKPIYHGFQVGVDESVNKIVNVNYKYGLLQGENKTFFSSSSGSLTKLNMLVPEFFEIEWETQDGAKHVAKVPVRGRVPGRVKRNTVLFIVYYDYVEGYKKSITPHGAYRDKFID